MAKVTSTGQLAEDIVAFSYVRQKGWKVLARNYRKPWGELDIIARHKKTVILIEVKALNAKNTRYFKPEQHFTYKKQERLKRAAASYLQDNKYPENVEYTIDLAAVELDYNSRNARIRYYKNAIAQ